MMIGSMTFSPTIRAPTEQLRNSGPTPLIKGTGTTTAKVGTIGIGKKSGQKVEVEHFEGIDQERRVGWVRRGDEWVMEGLD